MSLPSSGVSEPSSAGEALQMAVAGLGWLARADLASVPVPVQAEALRVLERAASMQTAARARVLAAFSAQRGFEDDGQGSARMWLTWQTRVTAGAARGTVGWMRRLENHPAVAEALAGGVVSVSWARQLTDWTGALPVAGPAGRGRDLARGGGGAARIWPGWRGWRRRSAAGSPGRIRTVRTGSATAACSWTPPSAAPGGSPATCRPAAPRRCSRCWIRLGKKMGAEDTRSQWERQHDALEEACVRLLGAGVPAGAGRAAGPAGAAPVAGPAARRDRPARPAVPAARVHARPGPAASVGRRPGPAAGTWLAGSRRVRAGAGGGVGRAR